MGHLSLRVLGPPEVQHGGRILKFRTRKALALLIYLAVEGGSHAREKITKMFWPESDASRGRTALRRILADLRSAIDDPAGPSHLVVTRDSLGLAPNADVHIDLSSLDAAFTLSQLHPQANKAKDDPSAGLLDQLRHAAMVCRGGFLEGFSIDDVPDFDEWIQLQGELAHRRVSTVLDHLSQLQLDRGELASATEAAARWVAHDPLNESAHRRLMAVLFATGDRGGAMQAFAACRAVIARQVDANLAPETEALAERIRTQPPPHIPSSATRQSSTHSPALPEAPLVGRADEFGKLIEVWFAVERGQARVVVLTGETGIGKTRLAAEFLGWAAARGADILQGRAFQTGGRLPYQPLVEALRRRVERENSPDDLLSNLWLAELSRLLPELRDRYPDLAVPSADETTARIHLFEAVARLLQSLASRTPVVLLLDDVQWADSASLDALHYAGRRSVEAGTPLLVLLCLRAEALVTAPALSRWLGDVKSDLPVTTLTLGLLSLNDTIQLLQSIDNASSTNTPTSDHLRVFGTWLYNETRGQPLYVVETLKALLERGLLTVSPIVIGTSNRLPLIDNARSWGIDFEALVHHNALTAPDGILPSKLLARGVRDVIRSRLDQLTPSAVALLTAGAVLGHGFTFEQLEQVAALTEWEGLLALDELLRGRLISEGDGMVQTLPGTYSFTHDKIRDVVYTEAGEARRRVFHRRALHVLEAAAAPPAELANHAHAAELMEPAFRLSLAAGNAAMELFAVRDAIAHYDLARRLVNDQRLQQNRAAGIPSTGIQHLYVHLGRAHELGGEFEQAREIYREMLAIALEEGALELESMALNRLATLAAQNPNGSELAMAFLHRALELARNGGETALLAETEWNLAQLHVYRFDPTTALPHGEQSLALARILDQKELIARSLNVLTYAQIMSAHWEHAELLAREALALYSSLGNRAMEADSLCLVAVTQINLGYPRASLTSARAARAISQEIENVWGRVNSAIPLAIASLETGAYGDALAFADEAVNLARAAGNPLLLAFSLTTLGTVRRSLLGLDAAKALHFEAMAIARQSGLQLLIEVIAAELCADCAMDGAWDEAQIHAFHALTARTDTFILSTKLTLWCETAALLRAGDVVHAIEDVRRFGELVGRQRRYRLPYLRALAAIATFHGDLEEAAHQLKEAATLAEQIGLPGEEWSIQSELGDLHGIQGDVERAHTAFERAGKIVNLLAESVEDAHVRANFLGSPLVQRALEHCAIGR